MENQVPEYRRMLEQMLLPASDRFVTLVGMIVSPEEARLLLAMPGQPAELAQRLALPLDIADEMIRVLYFKGLAFPSPKTDPPTWRMARDFVQFHDATILWPEAPQAFLDQWQDIMENEWPDLAKQFNQLMPRPFTRVIPVGVAVQADTQVLSYENVHDIIEKAQTLAVTKCTCRLTAHKCDRPLEACLQVNKAAAYSINRGTGREVSKAEALEILRKAEETGLIHVTMNKHQVDHFICNCCPCCCQTMPILIQGGIRVIDPSRFQARVDPEVCLACGACLERCYFGALQAGADEKTIVEGDKCLGCGLCRVVCPTGALTLEAVRPEEFVPEKYFS
ncbi:MAG: 4Fe-4S binding protein [Desulfobacterota bacterium]|nr:4Fe-4S binding protein [Thermodesulfobacteriota bacterium]